MKIVILSNFSHPSICGVWTRAQHEAKLLAKHHEVRIFSSNSIKGTKLKSEKEAILGNLKITRFPSIKLGGESFLYWNFAKEILKFKPDIIMAHSYRQLHTTKALKITKKLKCKVFLVTHAPFVEGNITRTLPAKIAVKFYDKFIAPITINKFDKIIAITKWEIPYLLKLGAKKDKIVYIPNGIPDEFFTQKKSTENKKILFLGRIAPIKNIETLIRSMRLLKDKDINLEIVGPAEEEYLKKLKSIMKGDKRITFTKPIYNIEDKIKKIDSAKIFVLPSIRESMPQSLIEAMAREKIAISSDNKGARDLIEDDKNGYLFKVGNYKELAQKINQALKNGSKIGKEAKKSVEKFSWSKVIQDTLKLIEN